MRLTMEPGTYVDVLMGKAKFRHVKGEPKGVTETILHRHPDGSYTHIVRIEKGVKIPGPFSHEFYEEAYYIEGEMKNERTDETIAAGMYVFHEPREEHGPFTCVKPCVILEFRYYK
jgi:hypothetical protein